MIVFFISGLWHGASWAFVVWGVLHGFYLIAGRITAKTRNLLWQRINLGPESAARNFVGCLVTFHLVLVAWVFFRAGRIHSAREVFVAMFHRGATNLLPASLDLYYRWGLGFSLVLLEIASAVHERSGLKAAYQRLPSFARVAIFCGGIGLIFIWGSFESRDFIYFQF